MIKINFLSPDEDHNSKCCNLPIKINRKMLLDTGIDASIFKTPTSKFYESDILCIDCRVFRETRKLGQTDKIYKFLEMAGTRVKSVLWFDTTDGTGSPQFDVLPYVTAYYKSSILKNKSKYLDPIPTSRIFLNYYYKHFNIKDDITKPQTENPSASDLSRIFVFWNTALGSFGPQARLNKLILYLLTPPYLKLFGYQHPDAPRPVDITCRIGLKYHLNSLVFHRTKIAEILKNKYSISLNRLPKKSYFKEIQSSKIGISPFGYGEIAYRDFEIFISGAALLKPDMSYLETWPNLYIDNDTYISHKWDFTDLTEKIDSLLTNDNWRRIAQSGYDKYRHYILTQNGREAFCNRVKEIIERHK